MKSSMKSLGYAALVVLGPQTANPTELVEPQELYRSQELYVGKPLPQSIDMPINPNAFAIRNDYTTQQVLEQMGLDEHITNHGSNYHSQNPRREQNKSRAIHNEHSFRLKRNMGRTGDRRHHQKKQRIQP
jgi:hypothetical protein